MVIHSPFLHRLDALTTTKWTIYSFSIPLISGGVREGLIVRIENESLGVKWCEVAPLPGRSQESLNDALEQLLEYFSKDRRENLCASVQFGLENLFQTTRFPLKASTYAFLTGTKKTILDLATIAKEKGYSTVKFKVGSFSIKEAQEVIESLSKLFRLRVDCNSAFSFQDALHLFQPFAPDLFDYIEDPTYEIGSLQHFTHPFALDETIAQYRQLPLPSYKNLYGFILKPTILGGKKGCLPLVEYARKHQLKVILSPAFETGLGLLQILKLGQELEVLDDLIGLDTHRFLQQDVIEDTLCFNTPEVTITKEPEINLSHLKHIAGSKITTIICSLACAKATDKSTIANGIV